VSVPSSGGNGQSEVSDASSSSESAADWSRFGPFVSIVYILIPLCVCVCVCVSVCVCVCARARVCYMFKLSEFRVYIRV
jgi:hypothetical protein